ncbi:MAG: acyl-CoA thioesterase [Myxococcales bacterium]|jgi:4-hydroxybenzoyl-CoA thioesterase|nr:acyl-CoA thioesterase [Myxococcales bacterium]MBL0197435.1 acyl-CoA thioesterase [Myxococcales bacterium]
MPLRDSSDSTSSPHRDGPGLCAVRRVEVSWGDCDASGIVFYPRYYAWFDECTHALLAGVGLGHDVLRERYRLTGAPLVQAAARFRSPATYGDTLLATSRVARVGSRSFTVEHRLAIGDRGVVEGEETRVWAEATGSSPPSLRAVAIPDDVRALLLGA